MAKITFRADDDLVERVEALERSKSEVMRTALRRYLDAARTPDGEASIDDLVAERVDAAVEERLSGEGGSDVNVSVTVEPGRQTDSVRRRTDEETDPADAPGDEAPTPDRRGTCSRCGERLEPGHAYCPNCGEQAVTRVVCDCGDELQPDWAYCPNCGRPTPSAGVLER